MYFCDVPGCFSLNGIAGRSYSSTTGVIRGECGFYPVVYGVYCLVHFEAFGGSGSAEWGVAGLVLRHAHPTWFRCVLVSSGGNRLVSIDDFCVTYRQTSSNCEAYFYVRVSANLNLLRPILWDAIRSNCKRKLVREGGGFPVVMNVFRVLRRWA